jgi:hypothetical protein
MVNRPAEWAEMFGDAWRTMKYRFTIQTCTAWIGRREGEVRTTGEGRCDRQELMNIINEMIGELNASHLARAPGGRGAGVSTGNPVSISNQIRRTLQGLVCLRKWSGRQGLGQGQRRRLPDCDWRQGSQSRRRVLGVAERSTQSQSRSHLQQQAIR